VSNCQLHSAPRSTNGAFARSVADDAIFAKTGHGSGSIATEFAREGVHFRPARTADRLTGWNVMRRLLSDAGKPDVLGLHISRTREYFWACSLIKRLFSW